MTSTWLLALVLLSDAPNAADRAVIGPIQPECPWNQEALTPLWPVIDPQDQSALIASNASIFFRVNDGVTAIGDKTPILQDEDGASVAMTTNSLPIPTGALLELRPMEQLKAGSRYLLRYESSTAELTATGPIFGAPEPAQISRITPIDQAPANTACLTSGVVVQTVIDRAELRLFVDDEDQLLAASNAQELIIIGTPGIEVCGRVIAMDSVGRRAAPSERACAFATQARAAIIPDREQSTWDKLGCSASGAAVKDDFELSMVLALFGLAATLLRSRTRRT